MNKHKYCTCGICNLRYLPKKLLPYLYIFFIMVWAFQPFYTINLEERFKFGFVFLNLAAILLTVILGVESLVEEK